MRRVVCATWLCLLAGTATATDYRANAQDYRDYVRRLQPGDRLLLAPGDYLHGLPLRNLSGLADQPIIIEAAQPGDAPHFIARPGANTVSLADVRYLVLRHLELDGRNQPVDAVKAEGHSHYADFITLDHLYIHDHAASQQNVGISTKCPAFGWVIRGNRIERVGTGLYLGDADGSDPFVGGLIEANRISHTLGYNLQIKHQASRPAGHVDRHDTVIRYNVFSKQDALPGPQARPNVLLGHVPLSGAGSRDRYLVYGNLFLHNPSEALMQAEGRVALYDNVFINSEGDAIHIQPHNDVPRDMVIFSNTVLASGTGIQVRRAAESPYRQRVIANVVAAAAPLRDGEAAYNLISPYRADLLDIAVSELTPHLLAQRMKTARLPQSLVRELAAYPGWKATTYPGARVSSALQDTLDASWP
ncbi:right-handed parallel beta-helix repeat-containing protein [Thiobacillus sp.]